MNQYANEIPLEAPKATLNGSAYPSIDNMTTSNKPEQNTNQQEINPKGGAGCLTDFLAAIGCCCICEDCCC
ncbi:hypothetical protein K501DRAFT_282318 [Backusella circina FSU 941]|nr:hypothetical protein K501DRAFT_282318 [Backusella circina FSU 941]